MECNDSFPARYRAAVFIGTSVVALSGDTEAPLCCRTLWLRHRGFLGEVRNLNVTELGPGEACSGGRCFYRETWRE